jgi:hypothetical protein
MLWTVWLMVMFCVWTYQATAWFCVLLWRVGRELITARR